MKCKYCGYEAPVISGSSNPEDEEFITLDKWKMEPILVCPNCGKEQ